VTDQRFSTPNQWRVMLGIARYSLLAILRNKTSLFFNFILPIVLVLVFGSVGGGGTNKAKIGIDSSLNQQNAVYQALKQGAEAGQIPVEFIDGSSDELEKKLSQSKVDAILINPTDATTSIGLKTSNGNPTGKATAENILRGTTSQLSIATYQEQNPNLRPSFAVQDSEISGRSFKTIDYALPGLIAFSLLALATFGIAFPFITMRETLVLKRIFATTVRPLTFIASQGIARSVVAMLQVVVLLGIGVYVFDFSLSNGFVTLFDMIIIAFFGLAAFFGFGVLIANVAKDEQSAPVLLNIFNLPQFILTGAFFPTESFPKALQLIGDNLPLAYLANALRKVSIEGASLFQVWPYLLGLTAWAAVAYILAAKTFRSE
jgi:ABC-2 type transport system permease protein